MISSAILARKIVWASLGYDNLRQSGRRLIVIRLRIDQRPQADSKYLLEVPDYRFQALVTQLTASVSTLTVKWLQNGLADIKSHNFEYGLPRMGRQ